jgi:hypothetical protein
MLVPDLGPGRGPDARGDTARVYIQAVAARIEDFHRHSFHDAGVESATDRWETRQGRRYTVETPSLGEGSPTVSSTRSVFTIDALTDNSSGGGEYDRDGPEASDHALSKPKSSRVSVRSQRAQRLF